MAETLRGASRDFTWRVVALDTPRVWRRCPGCDQRRAFRSSDRFRVNAQQRRVDVWLVYRCTACDGSWNCTVVTRRTPADIGADLARYERNDPALARRCAFDRALLARAGARLDDEVAFRVDVVADAPQVASAEAGCDAYASVALALTETLDVRLERVVATALGVARARLERWVADGALHVAGAGGSGDAARALRRPARDGQLLLLRASALAALTAATPP